MDGPYTANRIAGRRVVVDRLDRDGAALARLLRDRGADVVIADPAPSAVAPDGVAVVRDRVAAAQRAELLLVDCWTAETAPHVVLARERGATIGSLADLVLREARVPVVGVTGTAGKTTTTRLIAALLERGGRRVHVPPTGRAENAWPSADTLDVLAADDQPDLIVLELTSTHLAYMAASPAYAVLTCLWPDHVELHGGEGRYIAAKQRILARQRAGDVAVLPAGETRVAAKPGVRALRFAEQPDLPDAALAEVPIPMRSSVAAAVALVREGMGIDVDVAATLAAFPLPAWRGEPIGAVDGVPVLHDGMAATPAKAAALLRGLPDASAVVIAGGIDDLGNGPVHRSPAEQRMLVDACAEIARVGRRIALFGPAASRIAPLIAGRPSGPVGVGPDLHWAVAAAVRDVAGAEAIVFAPGFPIGLEERARFADLVAAAAGPRWRPRGRAVPVGE